MEIDEIQTLLIGNVYLMEAIEETIQLAEKLSTGLRNHALILKSRLEGYQLKGTVGINVSSDIAQVQLDLMNFLELIKELTNSKGEIVTSTKETLLIESSFPFIDRITFRKLIKETLQLNEAKMIFVKGDPKSGMSYLEKYLMHLSKKNKLYQIIPIEIPYYLDDPLPCKGVRLAKFLSEHIGLSINLNETEDDLFKFIRFTTKLKESLSLQDKIPIFFIHDFHRLAIIPDDLIKFIFNIAITIRNNFPKSIFIIAGLNCELLPNWHTDLRQLCPIYSVEHVDEQAIKDCLGAIFDKYKNRVFKIFKEQVSKDDYIEGMMLKLVPDMAKIDLASLNLKIMDHLNALKA